MTLNCPLLFLTRTQLMGINSSSLPPNNSPPLVFQFNSLENNIEGEIPTLPQPLLIDFTAFSLLFNM